MDNQNEESYKELQEELRRRLALGGADAWIGHDQPELPWPWDMEDDQAAVLTRDFPNRNPTGT